MPWWIVYIEVVFVSVSCFKTNSLNIGTALFRDIDDARDCWSKDEIALLNSRRIMQDLIPCGILNGDTADAYVPAVLEYFQMCVGSIWEKSRGRARHFLLLALADVFGGFLHVYALPFTKERYYAGIVRYEYVKKLYDLYDDLKTFLMTNGGNWRRPRKDLRKGLKVLPLPRPSAPSDDHDACADLIVYSKSSAPGATNSLVFIPLPLLDEEPCVIAMPFKGSGLSLLNLKSPRSAFVLVRYYQDSIECLMSTPDAENSIKRMNTKYFHWLHSQVMPHLGDDGWYAGFGGVLRIIKTLAMAVPESHDYYDYEQPQEEEEEGRRRRPEGTCDTKEPTDYEVSDEMEEAEAPVAWYKRWTGTVMALTCIAVLVLTCCLLILCCVRRRRRQKAPCDDPECTAAGRDADSSSRLFNTVVQVMYSMRNRSALSSKDDLEGERIETLPPMLDETQACPMKAARCQVSARPTSSSQEGSKSSAANKGYNSELSTSDNESLDIQPTSR